MKKFALAGLLLAGLVSFVGCGEQAKPIPANPNFKMPPEDSGMGAGASKPEMPKPVEK